MRVLLDECVPRSLRRYLPGHDVRTVPEMGWSGLRNGPLLRKAAVEFDVFVSVDQGIPFQQSVAGLDLGVIVVVAPANDVAQLRPLMSHVLASLGSIARGQVVTIRV